MNKTKIKNFSIWARRNLIEVVAYRMRFLGIDENGIAPVTFIYTGEDEDADKFLGAFRKLIENPSLAFI